MHLPRYIVTEKDVGETPLVALERARRERGIPQDIPLTYAGRLDPMASGTLLILVGDECKRQDSYRTLDKEYVVELLFGISSDTGDVLGRTMSTTTGIELTETACRKVLKDLHGPIALPYPHFSSKTVHGKPLHTWTLEQRLDEIEVPVKHSTIHRLSFGGLRTVSRAEILEIVRAKIETVPPVTDIRKALGEDFRRDKVREGWQSIEAQNITSYQILTFTCTASSGTYMRSLCEHIAQRLGTTGLAYSIRRTKIGRFFPLFKGWGLWLKQFCAIDS